jgi:DnaJ-class molecular chaperone
VCLRVAVKASLRTFHRLIGSRRQDPCFPCKAELGSHRRGLASTFALAMEGAEHSSRELTVSVKVPCQECGGLGYTQRVKAGHVVGDKTTKCRTCRGRGLIPDDMPVSQLRELLK